MIRKVLSVAATLVALAACDLGVNEAKAQYLGVPVAAPGVYKVKVRGRGYRAREWVAVPGTTVVPTTTIVSSPVVTETRLLSPTVVSRSYVAPTTVVTRNVVTAAPTTYIDRGVVTTSALVPTRYAVPAPVVVSPAPVVIWP